MQTVKAYRGSKDIAPIILNLPLNGDERSDIRQGQLLSEERTSCNRQLHVFGISVGCVVNNRLVVFGEFTAVCFGNCRKHKF